MNDFESIVGVDGHNLPVVHNVVVVELIGHKWPVVEMSQHKLLVAVVRPDVVVVVQESGVVGHNLPVDDKLRTVAVVAKIGLRKTDLLKIAAFDESEWIENLFVNAP